MGSPTEFLVKAYKQDGDVIPIEETRVDDSRTATHQKALWERAGTHVTVEERSSSREAWEEEERPEFTGQPMGKGNFTDE